MAPPQPWPRVKPAVAMAAIFITADSSAGGGTMCTTREKAPRRAERAPMMLACSGEGEGPMTAAEHARQRVIASSSLGEPTMPQTRVDAWAAVQDDVPEANSPIICSRAV
jgi:hypothetical protein